jgi:hypothetical protein
MGDVEVTVVTVLLVVVLKEELAELLMLMGQMEVMSFLDIRRVNTR